VGPVSDQRDSKAALGVGWVTLNIDALPIWPPPYSSQDAILIRAA
jgi:hypothetical protein